MKMKTTNLMIALLSLLSAIITTSHQQECVTILDLIIAFDGSNSMGQDNFEQQKRALYSVVSNLNVSDSEIRVGVILFSGKMEDKVILTGDKNRVLTSILNMGYPDESTRTDIAFYTGIEMFEQFGRDGTVPQVFLLVTDGKSTEPTLTNVAANIAKSKGINIYCIGVTDRSDINELNQIATHPSKVFFSENFNSLEASLNNATFRACVDLKCRDSLIDIVFVLDSSFSVGAENFQIMKDFIFEFLLFADVDGGKIRVGAVTYSNTANVQFNLITYRSKPALSSAINSLLYTPGAPGVNKLVDALGLLRTQMFSRSNGDRTDATNIVIILSASNSNVNTFLASEEADRTRAHAIQIYGIGIGHRSSDLLDSIVSRPVENNRFLINSFPELRTLVQEVYNKFNRFCEKPPPVPPCDMGNTDIWFVVDVSKTAEILSREQYTGDFAKQKNGLSKMLDIVRDPSVDNSAVNSGLIAYSDTSSVLSDISIFSSVNGTISAIQQLPGITSQGATALIPALRNIVSPAAVFNDTSYVAIVAPESSYVSNMPSLSMELSRLKNLGYTIVPFVVRENGSLDQQTLMTAASGSRYFYYIPSYTDLEAATKNFTRDRICEQRNTTGLCADSGHKENGVGVVAHPQDCDKYIQCYFDERKNVDIGVVRQCPMGLHWNAANKTCSKPSDAGCANDRCKESCEPYKMVGSCRAYWDCENGLSTPKCCPENQTFVPGVGCQPDATCKDPCGPTNFCGACQKKPNWTNPSGYAVKILGSNMWSPRPCFYDDFDIVDCDCSVLRDEVCPADRVYDFTDSKTKNSIDDGSLQGIRIYEVEKNSDGIVLGNRSAVHVSVNRREDGSEPFTIELRFREMGSFSPYGETLVSSGLTCGGGNSLLIFANDEYIFAEVRSSRQSMAQVKVPTKDLNKGEFKNLVLSYGNGIVALSISDGTTQYIAKSQAPSSICLACGLDIGQGLNKLGFDGELQKISIYSCAWPILY